MQIQFFEEFKVKLLKKKLRDGCYKQSVISILLLSGSVLPSVYSCVFICLLIVSVVCLFLSVCLSGG